MLTLTPKPGSVTALQETVLEERFLAPAVLSPFVSTASTHMESAPVKTSSLSAMIAPRASYATTTYPIPTSMMDV